MGVQRVPIDKIFLEDENVRIVLVAVKIITDAAWFRACRSDLGE